MPQRIPIAAPTMRDDRDDHDDDDDDGFVNDLDADEEAEMSDEEAADTEAWIEQIIEADRTGGKIPPPPPPRR